MAAATRTEPAERLAVRRPLLLSTGLVAAVALWFAANATSRAVLREATDSATHVGDHLVSAVLDEPGGARAALRLAASSWHDAGAAAIYRPAVRSPGTLVRESHVGRVPMPATVVAPTADDGSERLLFEDAVLVFRPLSTTGGWVAVGRSLLAGRAGARRELAGWFVALSLLVITASAVGGSVERRIVDGLRRVLSAMVRITNGHLGERIDTGTADAVGLLAARFNTMARGIQDSRREMIEQSRALERRVAERTAELQRANHTLKTLDQAKDAFLANVSHELRTPLTAILASTGILRDLQQADGRTLAEFVSIIEHEARRLLALIGSALSVAETESTLPALRRLPVDLVRLCEQVVARCGSRCAERGVTVVRRTDVVDPVARVDEEHVAAALECLLDNAAKFSPRGGTIEVVIADDDDELQIEIRDEGPGVPEPDRERVFERFTQAGSVLTDKPKGFGLGLPLSRRIAQAHGGYVEYRELPDWGATFVMRLPRDAVPSRPWLERSEEDRRGSRQERDTRIPVLGV